MNNLTNYSMVQGHNFVSPMRGTTASASAAVPHQHHFHKQRDMSSSPYVQKKSVN